ncbi:MAG: DUF1015 domain-containing protein [Bryobacteraceae bacterium]|nr:DUF1015 domain-containing protein [Bryobacteraceae bacterium]
MARIFPFRPYRYAPSAGPLDRLVTQPYDKISPAMQARYLSLSPYNLVRIILGERKAGDTDEENVYTRAAAHFEAWRREGVLQRDATPAFYAYFQEFTVPGGQERLVRKGFIGLGAVEDYEARIVHRHEQTLSGPKKDRLQVLEHTRAHFGQIFMLYPDPERAVDAILDEAAQGEPAACVTDEYGAVHTLWRIDQPAQIEKMQALMADKKLLIADGHHRYETALNFRNAHPELPGAANVMMTFVNMHSPGLRILATHRVVSNVPSLAPATFLERAAAHFSVTPLVSQAELEMAWAAPHAATVRIGVAFPGDGPLYLLETPREGRLDVPVLHETVLRDVLGISEEAVRDEKHLKYVRGLNAAVKEVREGGAQAAFLLEPTPIEDMARISFGGGVMPQKSTDFYPKLLSGLTIYKVDEA